MVPSSRTVETLHEKALGTLDILGQRSEESPGAVVRLMSMSPQRFMLLQSTSAPGAMLTERAASPPLSSSGD
jgi:hypothetical protein